LPVSIRNLEQMGIDVENLECRDFLLGSKVQQHQQQQRTIFYLMLFIMSTLITLPLYQTRMTLDSIKRKLCMYLCTVASAACVWRQNENRDREINKKYINK